MRSSGADGLGGECAGQETPHDSRSSTPAGLRTKSNRYPAQ